jgi:hypothetical protein
MSDTQPKLNFENCLKALCEHRDANEKVNYTQYAFAMEEVFARQAAGLKPNKELKNNVEQLRANYFRDMRHNMEKRFKLETLDHIIDRLNVI